MKNIEYKKGDKINNLTYLHEVAPYKYIVKAVNRNRIGTDRKALFQCYCGNQFETIIRGIRRGHTKSCGCAKVEGFSDLIYRHGLATPGKKNPIYVNWQGMKDRCYNVNNYAYKDYGGRGITVADEFHDPVVFYNYVVSLENCDKRKALDLTIDRIDNNRGYERGNLRWATRRVQRLNQRTYDPSRFNRTISLYYEKFGLPV